MSYTFPYCNMICTDSCLCNNKFHTLKECRATQLRIRVAGGAIVTILCDCDSGNIFVYSECLSMWNAWKLFAKITKSPYRTKMILTKSRCCCCCRCLLAYYFVHLNSSCYSKVCVWTWLDSAFQSNWIINKECIGYIFYSTFWTLI